MLVRTALTLLSTGTENIVFNRAFDPGTHWERWVRYPFHSDYTAVGKVIAVGPGVAHLRLAGRVAHRKNRASHAMARAEDCFLIPKRECRRRTPCGSLWRRSRCTGCLSAGIGLGNRVLIVGAGPSGRLALHWTVAAGAAHVTLIAPQGTRRPRTRGRREHRGRAKHRRGTRSPCWRPTMANGRTWCSTRRVNAAVFAAALALTADHGTVIVLGDTGAPAEQQLSSDVITRGLHTVGAHDGQMLPG